MTVFIVTKNQTQARAINMAMPSHSGIKAIYPAVSQLAGRAMETIIVNPDVDLAQIIEGEGSLESLLRGRQLAISHPRFIVL